MVDPSRLLKWRNKKDIVELSLNFATKIACELVVANMEEMGLPNCMSQYCHVTYTQWESVKEFAPYHRVSQWESDVHDESHMYETEAMKAANKAAVF